MMIPKFNTLYAEMLRISETMKSVPGFYAEMLRLVQTTHSDWGAPKSNWRTDMLSTRTVSLVVGVVVLLSGCAAKSQLDPTVMNDIAACTGGYSTSRATLAEIQAELLDRSGRLISSDELSEKGESAFAFGELNGTDAVAMYNRYVQCMNARQREVPGTEARSRSQTATNRIGAVAFNGWVVQYPPPGSERVGHEIRLEVDLSEATRKGTLFNWRIRECNARQIGGRTAPFFRFRVDRSARCAIYLWYGGPWAGGESGPFWVHIEQ